MRRTYERGTKARLILSGWSDAAVNMADSMEEVNVGEDARMAFEERFVHCNALYFVRHVFANP